MAKNAVSQEVLLDGAQMCIAATIAGIAGFLKERNIPLVDLVNYMGSISRFNKCSITSSNPRPSRSPKDSSNISPM